jgi:hypothetical protein
MDLVNKTCGCVPILVRDKDALQTVWVDKAHVHLQNKISIQKSHSESTYLMVMVYIDGILRKLSHIVLNVESIGSNVVNHIDGNTQHICPANLRLVTPSQNSLNVKKRKNTSSIYKGVCKTGKKWVVSGTFNSKHRYLGKFDTEIEAGKAFDRFMYTVYKDFQVINNNLLTEAEIQVCKASVYNDKPTKARDDGLRNIRKNKKTYTVDFRREDMVIYKSFKTLAEAQTFRNQCEIEIEVMAQAKLNQPICRNSDGVAMILSNQKRGEQKEILVDDNFYERINKHAWTYTHNLRAVCSTIGGKSVRLGDFVLELAGQRKLEGQSIDHKFHNLLDHRLASLRYLYASDQNQNRRKRNGTSSRFQGVFRINENCWTMTIYKDYQVYQQSGFKTEVEAAREYNRRAILLFSDPKLNVFDDEENKCDDNRMPISEHRDKNEQDHIGA